jgi:hypothetical protein
MDFEVFVLLNCVEGKKLKLKYSLGFLSRALQKEMAAEEC